MSEQLFCHSDISKELQLFEHKVLKDTDRLLLGVRGEDEIDGMFAGIFSQ